MITTRAVRASFSSCLTNSSPMGSVEPFLIMTTANPFPQVHFIELLVKVITLHFWPLVVKTLSVPYVPSMARGLARMWWTWARPDAFLRIFFIPRLSMQMSPRVNLPLYRPGLRLFPPFQPSLILVNGHTISTNLIRHASRLFRSHQQKQHVSTQTEIVTIRAPEASDTIVPGVWTVSLLLKRRNATRIASPVPWKRRFSVAIITLRASAVRFSIFLMHGYYVGTVISRLASKRL